MYGQPVPVVTCRICGHAAPSSEMRVRRPIRVFACDPVSLPDRASWVCLDTAACFARFR